MKNLIIPLILAGLMAAAPGSLIAEKAKEPIPNKLSEDAAAAIELFKKTDPKMSRLFSESAGYAVFPSVGKGGLVIGAAHGRGVVYANAKPIGTAKMTQVTVGAQLGGQAFSQVIFFEDKQALDAFTESQWTMNAQVNAVAAAEGASANARYQHGVMVFTMAKSGLMFEASVGGQKFKFIPLRKLPRY